MGIAEHLRIASCLNLIGTALHARGELAAAIPLYQQSRAQYERLVGIRQINYATVSNNLAAALRESGRFAEAESMYRDVVDHFTPRNRAESEYAIAAQVGLGLTLAQSGRATEALPLVERALLLSRERFAHDHWRISEAELAMGVSLAATGQPAPAVTLRQHAAATLQPHRSAQPRLAKQVDAALLDARR